MKNIESRVKGQNSVSFGGNSSFRRQSGRPGGSMSRSRLQSNVGLLTPDRAGSVQLLDEPAVEGEQKLIGLAKNLAINKKSTILIQSS